MAIEDVKLKVEKGIMKGLERIKTRLLNDFKISVPVDTGLLREQIIVVKSDVKGFTIRFNTDYASYIEDGTGSINIGSAENPRTTWKAKSERGDNSPSTMPFIAPVLYKNRKWMSKVLGEEIKKVLEAE